MDRGESPPYSDGGMIAMQLFRHDIQVKVYKEANKKYRAVINGGWWMAYGKTAKQAFKRVMKRYEHERDYA